MDMRSSFIFFNWDIHKNRVAFGKPCKKKKVLTPHSFLHIQSIIYEALEGEEGGEGVGIVAAEGEGLGALLNFFFVIVDVVTLSW
jgi:hypothetical protein